MSAAIIVTINLYCHQPLIFYHKESWRNSADFRVKSRALIINFFTMTFHLKIKKSKFKHYRIHLRQWKVTQNPRANRFLWFICPNVFHQRLCSNFSHDVKQSIFCSSYQGYNKVSFFMTLLTATIWSLAEVVLCYTVLVI